MAFYGGATDSCRWAVVIGKVTDADVERFVEHVRSIGEGGPGTVVLEVAHRITMPTPLQRQRITDAVRALPNKHFIGGHAVATNSAAARGVLTAVNWFVERSFPEKVFADPTSAAAWLAECNPAIDAGALLETIGNGAPPFGALRW